LVQPSARHRHATDAIPLGYEHNLPVVMHRGARHLIPRARTAAGSRLPSRTPSAATISRRVFDIRDFGIQSTLSRADDAAGADAHRGSTPAC
jgi:hypothetical protein